MKSLEVARNVVNQEDLEVLLASLSARYDNLVDWINGPLKKWILRKAPTKPVADLAETPGMPDWLKTSIQKGDSLVEIDVAATSELVSPVLDYMEDLLDKKPDTDTKQIGFETAQARSVKWHDLMRKQAENRAKRGANAVAVEEPGTTIVKQYEDGYNWRSVTSKAALVREGDIMGHCVGRFGYFNQVVRDKVTILSLRDEKNEPHVTIELRGDEICQIKGKANEAVLPKYMPYVKDYIKSRTWTTINFDKAPEIREEIKEHHRQTAPEKFKFGTLRMIQVLDDSWSSPKYEVLDEKRVEWASFRIGEERGLSIGDSRIHKNMISSLTVANGGHPVFPEFLAHLIIDQHLRTYDNNDDIIDILRSRAQWTSLPVAEDMSSEWLAPTNLFAVARASLMYGFKVDQILKLKTRFAGYRVNNEFGLDLNEWLIRPNLQTIIDVILGSKHPEVEELKCLDSGTNQTLLSTALQALKKLRSGAQIKTDSNKELMNTLLVALKQPTTLKLKQAAHALDKISDPNDSDFKSHGIPTGGRSITAISMLLAASLVRDPTAVQQYVFQKPHALNCFTEVLTQPDHVSNGLKSYGLDDEVIISIVLLLRNEFLRLLPNKDQIPKLVELEGTIKAKLLTLVKHVNGQHNNKQQSKEIWM